MKASRHHLIPRRSFLLGCACTAAVLLASPAGANYVGNDTQNFNPVASGLDFVTVHGSETLAPGYLNVGLFVNRASNVLPDTLDVAGRRVPSVDQLLFGDFSAAYGVSRNFEAGANVSYLLNQQTDRTIPGAQFAGTGLNEVRLSGKYKFVRNETLGAASIVSVNINQGRENPFVGVNASPTLNVEGVVDTRFGNTLLAGNIGYRMRSKGTPVPGALYPPLTNQTIVSLSASQYFPRYDFKLIGELFASKLAEPAPYVEELSSEAIVGVKYDARVDTAVHAGIGRRLSRGLFAPETRIYVGLNYAIDLIPAVDPSTPAMQAAAPVVEQVYEGYQPQDIEALRHVPFDEIMKKYEFQLRKAIGAGELEGSKPPFEVVRLDSFDFDFGSSKIKPEYHALLQSIAKYLDAEPKIVKLRIEGHTDSVGSSERNRKRSQERADSVRAFLENLGAFKGVGVEAAGFGAERPIADNGNFQGRKQNRRVEIRILRQVVPKLRTTPSGSEKSPEATPVPAATPAP